MSRPFKEVILFHNGDYSTDKILVTNNTQYQLKLNRLYILWRGSFAQFKRDFEIPDDAPLSTKQTGLNYTDEADFVKKWDWTTLNFKFNYHIWYRDGATTNMSNTYCLGSNNTIDLTIPNVLVYDGNSNNDNALKYYNSDGAPERYYNPNIFPVPISITSFVTSNKVDDFQSIVGQGTNSLCYLIFRYGVGGDDIQICLQTRDNGAFQVNQYTLVMPYASLTFTGFNKIKRLAGARDNI